jgi:hypothetical protein
MILHWIVSATLLGALLAIIGTCVTPVIARAGLPRRWLWLAAMIVSIGWPVWRAIAPHAAPVAVASAASAIADPAPAAVPARKLPADRTILLTWGALSLLLGGTLALSHWRTLRLMSQWEERSLFDAPIAVAPDFGPAAVGLIRPRVVIPDWVLELPADEQRLVLLHEQQHIRAGDHLVLLAGLSMVVLMPWNIGLWWQLRRLRIGMELDCDARVAPAPRDRPRYAELLLRARTHHQTRRLALALAPAPSALAERLMALLDRARVESDGVRGRIPGRPHSSSGSDIAGAAHGASCCAVGDTADHCATAQYCAGARTSSGTRCREASRQAPARR